VVLVVFGRRVPLDAGRVSKILPALNAHTHAPTADGAPAARLGVILCIRDPLALAASGVRPAAHVRVESWAPQPALMAHPKVTVAVHHGGPATLFETMASGVASLALPVGPDQIMNAALGSDAGVALRLDMKELSAAAFSQQYAQLLARRVELGARSSSRKWRARRAGLRARRSSSSRRRLSG
jgi:UDP:flavonoid glycosyltransferase YjiC (YdhE family)